MSKSLSAKLLTFSAVTTALLFSAVSQVGATACTLGGTDANKTISGSGCTLSENTDGADGGALAVGSGASITIAGGQTLAYYTSLTLAANSTISIAKTSGGGKIRKGYIYVTDADADGYRLNSATDAVFSSTPVVGKVRRNTATSGLDANDGQFCSSGYTGYTCYTCTSGAKVVVANGADPNAQCTAAGWNGCTNLCVKSTTNTGSCNGAGACGTNTANVAAGMICGSGTESAGECAVGYTCNGSGHCSYTDVYGEHILW